MRVLFLTKYYPPVEGGIERYSQLICQGLVENGVVVDVVAASESGGNTFTEISEGVTIHRLRNWGQFAGVPMSPSMPVVVRKLAEDCDLIHLNFPNPLADITSISLTRWHPTVVTYHCDILRNRLLLRAYKPLVEMLLTRVSCIIATSDNYVRSSEFLRNRVERCCVVPLPVDIKRFATVDFSAVERCRIKYGPYVLFAGRFVYYKGVDVLIDAISRVPEVKLLLVGRGGLENKLRDQVIQAGLGHRVKFLGKVDDEALAVLYHGAHCFVLPSVTRAEAFGIVLAEAMSCGTPVISTELQTGTSYVNQDGVTGFVVPPKNPAVLAAKIKHLLGDGELNARFGKQAQERVALKFEKNSIVGQTLAVYEDVLP